MPKEDLEKILNKIVTRIDKNVRGIYEIIGDLNLKICHMIKSKKYDQSVYYDNRYHSP